MIFAHAIWSLLLQDPRVAVPDAARLKRAEGEIREVFKEEYAGKTAADRRTLAQKMLRNALDTNDDPAARYVLLKEASSHAAQAGDLALGLRAIEEIVRSFEIDAGAVKAPFLAEAAKVAKTPEEHRVLTEAWLSLLQQAVAAEAFEAAEQAATHALTAGKKAKDITLYSRAEARAKEIAAGRAAAGIAKKARETLLKNPNDPAANLAVGRQECLSRGNWAVGLPLLAKGGNAALSELAARELAAPATAELQAALADGWWAVAEKESGEARAQARKHAASWYVKARNGLEGLVKMRADKRISEAGGEERTPGLAGFWSFDEGAGTSAADGSGNGGTATVYPGASWSAGALLLDGARGMAAVPDSAALNFESDNFTVACFIRPAGTNACRVVNKWHMDAKRGWILDINTVPGGAAAPEARVGRLRTRISDGQGNLDFAGEAKIAPDAWTHIALVLDRPASEARLYANGAQVAVQPFRTLGSVSVEAPVGIGCIPPTNGGFFSGSIDDVRLYRRALTPAQVAELAVKR